MTIIKTPFTSPSKRFTLAFLGLITVFVGVFLYNGKVSLVRSTSCGSSCSTKEIGTIDGLGNFSKTTSLTKGQPYWVRLTINGEDNLIGTPGPSATPAPKGVDTMLMIDLSSSMGDAYPKNNPDDGTTVLGYQAAQAALNKYIDLSDQANDYVGFGSFLYCHTYLSTSTPIVWSYDDYNRGNGLLRGFSAIHIPLKPINSNPNSFKTVINSINFGTNGYPDFCKSGGLSSVPANPDGAFGTGVFNGGTSLGGPITAAESYLDPVLSDVDSKRSDATSIRDSLLSKNLPNYAKNMGPYARKYTMGVNIPRYIILASDGREGAPPLVDDIDIDKNTRSIVNNAKFYGIKIFMAVTEKQSKVNATTLARINYITTNTGGKAYYGGSQQELVTNFSNIRNDIVIDANGGVVPTPTPVAKTSIKVTEKITSGYFKIDEPTITPATFKVTQPGSPETDVTTTMCADVNGNGVPDCVSNKKYDASGNLIGYDVTLDPIGFGQSRYVYFRVTPIKSTGGATINVDEDPTSVINYQDIPQTVSLDNVAVVINDPSPYFQGLGGGDIYSASGDVLNSIRSFLPNNTDNFITQGDGLVIHNGGSTFGNGKVNAKNREVDPYTVGIDNLQFSYNTVYGEYSNSIPSANIKSITGIADFTSSGYYIDSTSQTSGKYEIKGTGWSGKNIQGKKIVMFVPGDLYIGTNFTVQKDGDSLITFIVKGNIGIDPSVTNVQGVFIADEKIDTACLSASAFTSSNTCAPAAGGSGTSSSLDLEGLFISNSVDPVSKQYSSGVGGFLLDRTPASVATTAERFIYRPDFFLSTSLSIGRKNYSWIENVQ